MGNASYAPTGSGPFAGAIGWVTFPATSLAPNNSVLITSTLNDGSILSFTLTNTPITGNMSFRGLVASASRPFGGSGYAGITGNTTLSSNSGTFRSLLGFTNIVLKDSNNITIPNYTIVTCDGEVTTTGEGFIFQTDGGVWRTLGNIGSGTSPTFSGLGTTLVNAPGSGTTYHTLILATTSPQNVYTTIYTPAGIEAVTFGIILTKAQINKVVSNRAYSTDQFNLSLTSSSSVSTITTGTSNGLQSQSPIIYLTPDSITGASVVINETMAPGSTGTLSSNYLTTVQHSNLTPGGLTIPLNGSLGETLTVNLGDFILTTITNTAITSTLTVTKLVNKTKTIPGDTLTYTISLNNLGPLVINNTVFKDTIPTGSSFIANSVTVNGVSVSGSVAPPSGITLGTLPIGLTTLTFQVSLQPTLPIGATIANNATASGINILFPTTVNLSSLSNLVTTTILGNATLMATKTGTDYADIGNTLTYTITIGASGNTTVQNIILVDTLSSDTTFIPGSITVNGITLSGISPNPLSIPVGTLPSGSTSTVSFKVFVNTLPTINPIPNSGVVNYTFLSDPSISSTLPGTSPTNIVTTTINHADFKHITKSVDKDYGTCGDTLTYTISLPNSGTTDAINVILIDTLPNGTAYIPGSLQVNGNPVGGTPASISIGTIPAGSTSVVTFQVQITC